LKAEFNTSIDVMYSPRAQVINQVIALILFTGFVTALKINVGLPPTIIVGSSALIGFLCWRATNLHANQDGYSFSAYNGRASCAHVRRARPPVRARHEQAV
jgi:hypothetical protein